ncbi:hypothetical protein ZTR_01885 [Talaromyces verruculosus]|nr:hypothetical protein ZTR_01885 [Talaromyces verruculosus]
MSNNVLNQDFGSDEEDDDFNPAPAVDSDEEGAKAEEAGVDDDDEEAEDEEDDMGDGFGAEAHPDDLDALPVGAELDDRRHRQLDRQRELEAHMDAEKQAAALKERYGRNRMAATDSVVVPKRLLLPSVDDPSIWGVRCKPGKERDVVLNIQKRIEQRPPGTRHGLKIISAFERGKTMTGYVYIEARRQAEVMEALDGLLDVYPKTKMVLVPVKEMPDLLRVKKSEELNPGDWVRIKRGKYQGDLAQIEEVETNGLEVTVRLVPRLDYGLNEDLSAPTDAAKRKRFGAANNTAARPPQRLFSEAEASKKHGRHLVGTSNLSGKSWNYMGDTYIDGFLVKEMKIQHLITTNVNPRLEEVTMFARGSEDGTANIDLASLANTLKNTVAEDAYRPGDLVEVYKGEQQGIIGKTVATRGDIITLEVTEGDMKGQVIDAPIKTLRKRFREGDHVKVIGGSRYQDELGMVVQVKGDSVTILSDMSMEEITVFSKDLRLSTESGVDGKLGTFDVHDLVQLDATTVACIIQVDRESLRVIDQNGSVRNVLPSRIASKIAKRKDAVATDRNGAEIRHGDTVREMYGEQRSGVIMHIHRSFLFLHNKAQAENTGVIVVRTSNVVTVSAKGGRPTGPDLSRMNPAIMQRPPQGGAMPPPRVGRDRLIGKTVGITKGSYKGLIGIVRETTEDLVRVELHTKGTKVMVPRTGVVVKDPVTGQTIDMGRGGRPRVPGGPGGPPQPSWSGSRTPMAALDSRTPAWGGSLSSRTPAWGGSAASGSRTPAWKADGARTAYGGGMGGGRTPAWNSGARTPFDSGSGGGSGGGFDAFAAGSRTPAWGATTGSRTPAWTANSTSASSAAANTGRYDAPTPGGDYSAPTPGAYPTAPTPGASGTASTPRWAESAPTPGALNAPTPGAGGGGLSVGSRLPYDAPTPAMAATPGAMGDDNPTYLDDSE